MLMSDQPQPTESNKSALSGILKLAFIVTVILVAVLAMLLVTGTISTEMFNDYLTTLLSVIVISTIAAALIAILTGPGKS